MNQKHAKSCSPYVCRCCAASATADTVSVAGLASLPDSEQAPGCQTGAAQPSISHDMLDMNIIC